MIEAMRQRSFAPHTHSAGRRWRLAWGSHYLFPMRALSCHFRGHLVSALRQATKAGALHRVTRPGDVDEQLNALMATEWVVYSKDCLEHTHVVVCYLGSVRKVLP